MVLYDPMPDGSGLLDQILGHWSEVVEAARSALENCASACQESGIDCLQTFRNAYYHPHLNRHVALERIAQWGSVLQFSKQYSAGGYLSRAPEKIGMNEAEEIL